MLKRLANIASGLLLVNSQQYINQASNVSSGDINTTGTTTEDGFFTRFRHLYHINDAVSLLQSVANFGVLLTRDSVA